MSSCYWPSRNALVFHRSSLVLVIALYYCSFVWSTNRISSCCCSTSLRNIVFCYCYIRIFQIINQTKMQRRRSRVSNTINSMIDHFDCNYKIIKIDQKDLLSCQWQCRQKMGKTIVKIDGKWEWQKKWEWK